MENLIDSGRVFYAIKDLPLEQLHPEARLASVAARCAGEQDAYLEMHDAIFGAQRQWSGNRGGRPFAIHSVNMASELELDVDAFEICLDS